MPKNAIFSSQERLLEATLDLWEQRGHAAISARLLSQSADVPVSSLYHHFGSLEQLFVMAQEQATVRAARWCETQLAAFDGVPGGLPTLMAALIDEWTTGQRRLAFACRECQIMALRDPHYVPALDAWQSLWSSFWQAVCARCGLEEQGELTTYFFHGQSLLHLSQWRRAVDRACLEEICQGWALWLSGRLAKEGPWRAFARREADCSMPELALRNETSRRIADTAAATVEEVGMAGLTHRAVAQRAGLTLGIVSYNFRTSAELTRAAFESIYVRVVSSAVLERAPSPVPPEALIGALSGYDLFSSRLTGLDEVLLTVARDPQLRSFAPQLRYLRGRSSGGKLQRLLGQPVSPTDAALMSSFAAGQRQACVGKPEEQAHALLRRTLTALLHVLGKSGA